MGKTIKIPDNWVTQQQLADELDTTVQRVNNWIRRKKIDSKYFPEFRTTLVDKKSITARKYER